MKENYQVKAVKFDRKVCFFHKKTKKNVASLQIIKFRLKNIKILTSLFIKIVTKEEIQFIKKEFLYYKIK